MIKVLKVLLRCFTASDKFSNLFKCCIHTCIVYLTGNVQTCMLKCRLKNTNFRTITVHTRDTSIFCMLENPINNEISCLCILRIQNTLVDHFVVHYRGQIVASVTNFRNLLVQFHLPTYRQFSVTVKENTILARYGIHGIQCGLDSPLEVFSVHFKFFNKMGISVGLILAQKLPRSLILLQKQIVGERKAAQAYNDLGGLSKGL